MKYTLAPVAKRLSELLGKEVIMGIRPEDVHNEEDLVKMYKDGIVEANVEVTELMGAETYLYLDVDDNKFTARVSPKSKARPGDTIKIALDMSKIYLFDIDTEQTIIN